MKSRVFAGIGLVALLGSCATFGALNRANAGGQGKMERHPEMTKALRQLRLAKAALKDAKRDFDGHRAKALDLTDQAIKEVEDGIASDKH